MFGDVTVVQMQSKTFPLMLNLQSVLLEASLMASRMNTSIPEPPKHPPLPQEEQARAPQSCAVTVNTCPGCCGLRWPQLAHESKMPCKATLPRFLLSYGFWNPDLPIYIQIYFPISDDYMQYRDPRLTLAIGRFLSLHLSFFPCFHSRTNLPIGSPPPPCLSIEMALLVGHYLFQ